MLSKIKDEDMEMLIRHLQPLGWFDPHKSHNLSEMGKAIYGCGLAFSANKEEYDALKKKEKATASWLASFFRTRWYDYVYLHYGMETTVRTDSHRSPPIVCMRRL